MLRFIAAITMCYQPNDGVLVAHEHNGTLRVSYANAYSRVDNQVSIPFNGVIRTLEYNSADEMKERVVIEDRTQSQ